MIISPTEPPELRAIADRVSMYPEKHGCDISFHAQGKLVGIQRKEISDLFGSMEGKMLLPKQIRMMGGLDYAYLLIEGEPAWTIDGQMVGKQYGQRWTKDSYRGLLLSIADKGIRIIHSKSLTDTIHYLQYLERWHKKGNHTALEQRDQPVRMFGRTPMHREFATYVLQSLPGVGPELAKRIFDKYGLPLRLTIGVDELCTIEGLGPKKAKAIVVALEAKKATALITESGPTEGSAEEIDLT